MDRDTRQLVIVAAALAASVIVPATARAGTLPPPPQGMVIECGGIDINRAGSLVNLTLRYLRNRAMCGVAYYVAPKIYRASRPYFHSFRWGGVVRHHPPRERSNNRVNWGLV